MKENILKNLKNRKKKTKISKKKTEKILTLNEFNL